MATENILYYGDNLDVLRRHVKDDSVDLIYLDPPFNSNATYNVLFAEKNGSQSAAQIKAFEDAWQWDQAAAETYHSVVEAGGPAANAMVAFRELLGDNDMLAYLVMMAPRLIELRRVLKSTGSIYLHCDPTASHYLKVLLDAVFGPANFVNEVVWHRSQTRSSISRSYRRAHDVIFLFSKTREYGFNLQYTPLSETSLKLYSHVDDRGRYQTVPLLVSGRRHGETGKRWRGIDPNARGKGGMHWITTPQKLEEYERQGRVSWPKRSGGTPRLKYYLDETLGVPATDFWDNINPIGSSSVEALGYQTQKPEALLERIIEAGSNEGDMVLDPFCGCGTAISVAQRLKRRWIGIDVTHLAVTLIKHRLQDTFGDQVIYDVVGEPVSLPDAETLAAQDPYQFQWWTLGLVGARPVEQKKGTDKGVDGRLYFHDEVPGGKTKQIIFSVKAGRTTVSHLRDLLGVIEREKAAIGALLTMREPTKAMRKEAASAGFYESPGWNKRYPRIQILTVKELLEGKRVDYPPPTSVTFRKAPKAKVKGHEQPDLPLDG